MIIREFKAEDSDVIDSLALTAFTQFKNDYNDWASMVSALESMSKLAEKGEILVAENEAIIVGAVGYLGPEAPKAEYFHQTWPVIRMLVVDPKARGFGIGRALTEKCIELARRDCASLIALHTSPIMETALAMYLRMGFKMRCEAPPIHGVPYNVYIKSL